MKKTKLYFLLTALLLAGSTMAQTTVFEWTCGAKAPNTDNVSIATGEYGNMTVGTAILSRQFGSSNKMAFDKGYYKLGGNDIAIEIQGTADFEEGDTVFIVGKNGGDGDRGFEIGNSSAVKAGTKGNVLSTTANHTNDTTFTAVVDATVAGTTLRVFRLAGKTMYVKSIKVVRPAACTNAGLLLAENPDIEANVGEALTAPVLTNPNNVVVTYASSDESVVTVAADGTLTGVGVGDAVITISAALQTVGDELYCADELTYNVTIKSLSPVLEATESALDLSLNAFETTKSATFTVSGYNLTGEASVSTLPAGFTLDPATLTITDGAIDQAFTLTYTAEAAVEASNANLVFSVGTTSVTIALTYGKKEALTQTIVTDSTTWDWTKTGLTVVEFSDATTPSRKDTIVLANIDGIANNANFNSQALLVRGQFMVRDSKYFQGDYISFNVENAGTVKVEFSNTGNRTNAETETRYLYVNGAKTAAGSLRSDANVTSEEIAVPAGKVEITFMFPDETQGNQYCRVYKVTYRVKKDIGSAVEEAQVAVKAVKVIRDGQLLIIRDGKTYTAQGVQVQ